MSNTGRPDKKHIDSTDNRDAAKRPKKSHLPASDIDWLRDECGVESEPSKPLIEPEFGCIQEIDLVDRRDKPPVPAPFKRRNRGVQPDLAFLPYEAAQLAAPAQSFQQSCFDRKLIPFCVAGIMMTASVVSGAVVWSVHDDGVVSPKAELSAADSGASVTSRLDNDLKREVRVPKLDSPAVSAHSTEPMIQSSSRAVASDDRKPLPDNSLMSLPVSIQNRAALTSVQKNESDSVKNRTKASHALGGLPATLVAAANSGSMVDRIESSIAPRPPTLMTEEREANGAVPRQIKSPSGAKTAHLDNNSLARPPHKPSFKPLEVAASLPSAVVTTSFRPAFKPREISLLNPPRAGLLASSEAIDGAKHTPMLKRFWEKLVQGVSEAYRNRDTSYQLVMKADSSGGGSDQHRGDGGNDYDGHDG